MTPLERLGTMHCTRSLSCANRMSRYSDVACKFSDKCCDTSSQLLAASSKHRSMPNRNPSTSRLFTWRQSENTLMYQRNRLELRAENAIEALAPSTKRSSFNSLGRRSFPLPSKTCGTKFRACKKLCTLRE